MIAEIYPLTRLPRKCTVFDYLVPEGMTAQVGDLVAILFRKQKMFGVVRKLKAESNFKQLSAITAAVYPGLLTEADLVRYETIAANLALAPAQVLYSAIQDGTAYKPNRKPRANPPRAAKSLSISRAESTHLSSALKSKAPFIQLSSEGQIALALMLAKRHKHLLIIAPTARLCEEVASYAPGALVMHGTTPQKQTKDAMVLWREHGGILIGNKQATLLPTARLDAVLVLEATSDDYQFQKRNPRINPICSAELLAASHNAELITTDLSLPAEPIPAAVQPIPAVRIIDLTNEQNRPHALISQKALDLAKSALQKGQKVLILLNRRQSDAPDERATSTAQSALHQLLQTPIAVYQVGQKSLSGSVHLVTESFFADLSPIEKYGYGAVINLLADVSLSTSADAAEITYRSLCKLAYFARRQGAECLVQTFNASMFESMLDQETFMEGKRAIKRKYRLPPFSQTVRIEQVTDPALVLALLPESIKPTLQDPTTIEFSCDPTLWKSIRGQFTSLPDSYTLTLTTTHYEP